MGNWRESIAQNLVAAAIWALLAAAIGALAVLLAKATPIIYLFAPFSYLVCVLLALLLMAATAYLGARGWRHLYPAGTTPQQPAGPSADDTPLAEMSPARQREASHRKIAMRVQGVKYDAKNAIAHRSKNVGSIVSSMESLLATLERQFGVFIPDLGHLDGPAKLEKWLAYLDVVWPFLSDENWDRAKARSLQFITENGLQPES